MHISRLNIKRYKSLKEVTLEDLGKLLILIGKNSSGKSNILEAVDIFFRELDLEPAKPIGPVNAYLWFDFDSEQPIEIDVTLRMDLKGFFLALPEAFTELLLSRANADELRIVRRIVASGDQMEWRTESVVLNGIPLVDSGSQVTAEGLGKLLSPLPPPPGTFPADTAAKVLSQITTAVKNQSKHVPAARNRLAMPQTLGARSSFLDEKVSTAVLGLGQSIGPERKKWALTRKNFEQLSPSDQRLDISQSQILIAEGDLSHPLANVGGGTQEILILFHHVNEGNKPVVLLEEPELHFHPELIKRLLGQLSRDARGRQIWIATHSPFFVNRETFGSLWHVWSEQKETKVRKSSSTPELWQMVFDMGVRPSDLLFSDALLLAPGETEETVYPYWAEKFDVPLRELATILPLRGETKGRYHLKFWKEITGKAFQIPLFILLDGHAKNELEELRNQHLISADDSDVLDRHGIEDYYGTELIIECLEKEFGLPDPGKHRAALEGSQDKAKVIENLLKTANIGTAGFKVRLGRYAAPKMTADQIPSAARRIFERIKIVCQQK